jgi:hypothetical protein
MISRQFAYMLPFCWLFWYGRLQSSRAVFWLHASVATFNFYCRIKPWSAWRGSSFLEAMLFCSLNDNTIEVFYALRYLIASDQVLTRFSAAENSECRFLLLMFAQKIWADHHITYLSFPFLLYILFFVFATLKYIWYTICDVLISDYILF